MTSIETDQTGNRSFKIKSIEEGKKVIRVVTLNSQNIIVALDVLDDAGQMIEENTWTDLKVNLEFSEKHFKKF